jgi:hypothetical protein
MSQAKIRHLFPGGNTSLGFFSYYGSILPQEEANRIFILKGGPGVGKSTFMRRIGEKMLEKGYDIEHLHCSSDNSSLDGIHIPALKIAFIDGTSPHIVDPKSPGAVDEILNFGDFWDETGLRTRKREIVETNKKISENFARAYQYIKAAAAVYEGNAAIYSSALDSSKLNRFTAGLISELFAAGAGAAGDGKERGLFASALTPNGYCHYLDSVLTAGRVYELRGGLGTGEHRILEKVKAAAVERGYAVEVFYCALNPYKIEHLVIPDLDAALTTSNNYHRSTVQKHFSTDILDFMKPEVLEHYQEDMQQNSEEFDRLISIALQSIKKAKALHDHLETLYVPNIRFEEIDLLFEKTINRILR